MDKYQKFTKKLTLEFQKKFPKTYWVGGAVRDMLLNRKNFDIDIATSATPEQIKKTLKRLRLAFFDVGEKFGTIGLVYGGRKIELTTFRSESQYKDFRHPSKIEFIDDPKGDVLRRDLTVNALLYNPAAKEVIDFVGGQKDLKAKKIKFVGSPGQRINEDPLRMLRAIRLCADLDFTFEVKSFAAIKKHAKMILKTPPDRIKAELDKIFAGKNYLRGIELLDKSGLLSQIFPEVDRLKKQKQSANYHAEGNTFKHTMLMLEQCRNEDYIFRYAAFFHDIGKFGLAHPQIREGRPHISFPGHGPKGAEDFLKIAKRLRFSAKEGKKIALLIRHHMDLLHLEGLQKETLMKWSAYPDFIDLIKFRIADSAGSIATDKKGRQMRKDISKWQKLIKEAQSWQKRAAKKFATGNDVMRILKIKSGPRIGKVLQKIKIEQMRGKLNSRKDALLLIKSLDSKHL